MKLKDLERVHVMIPGLVKDLKAGNMGRRDFLRTTTLLGLSAGTAYAVAGKVTGEHFVPRAKAQGQYGGVLRIGMSVMEISDPAIFDWSEKGNIARQMLEQMVRVGTDNISHPWLAESWTANDDLTVWTFTLRQGVRWSNGDDFTSEDVAANFARWLDPGVGSSNISRFAALTTTDAEGNTIAADGGVELIDDHTIRFNLARPTLSFPESFGDYPALIAHRGLGQLLAEGRNFMTDPIGTGPFMLDGIRVGEEATLSKRPAAEYWGEEVYLDGLRYIDLGPDPQAHYGALASGQVDLLYTVDVNLRDQYEATDNIKVYDKTTAITGIARMRVSEPPFDNINVRKAIQKAVNRPIVLQLAYQNNGTVGEDHHVSPMHPEYTPLPPLEQDYAEARALLAETGHADGLEIDMQCVSDPRWESDIAQVLREMLAPAGITLNVQILPGDTYWERWVTWPFSITQWTSRPLGVQVLSLGYRTGVPWNETDYANPAFDALLDQAEATLDVEARRELVRDLQIMMQDDAIIVNSFWLEIYTASSDAVEGFAYHIAREQHFNETYLTV